RLGGLGDICVVAAAASRRIGPKLSDQERDVFEAEILFQAVIDADDLALPGFLQIRAPIRLALMEEDAGHLALLQRELQAREHPRVGAIPMIVRRDAEFLAARRDYVLLEEIDRYAGDGA